MVTRPGAQDQHRTLTLAFTGDVMLGRIMNDAIRAYGPLYPWGNTIGLLQKADLTFSNLECVIAADGTPWTRTPKVFHFRATPEAIEVLKVADIDYVSLANNHTLDFEENALVEMLDRLDAAGFAHAGAGLNLKEARKPAWLSAHGQKIAVISFTDNEPGWAATESSPGTNYVPINRTSKQFTQLKEDVRKARADGADILVVSAHWGPNMRERPSPQQVVFAHELMDAGCDIFHGHSAHIFQALEIYKGKPIFYDTGDFVDDYAIDPELRNDQGALYKLHIEENRQVRIEIVPTIISNYQVNIARGKDFVEIAERMRRFSREMKTDIGQTNQQLEVNISPSAMQHFPRTSRHH
jgi:poly-gamma-glutamate synthesis protein (capsule biosynthesis protein)